MRKVPRVVVVALALSAAGPVSAQHCPAPRTALVLSGGGAKGLAHIGVLRVLDSLGYRPDLIVGTSMGAIVGAMYASGYSGAELDSLARRYSLAALVRAEPRPLARTLGPLRPLVQWEPGRRGLRLRTVVADEAEINALVSGGLLRGNLLAGGNFDSLPIPFRAAATNLADGTAVVLSRGDLAQAVRASFAIPVILRPVIFGADTVLIDGGIADNVAVGPARADTAIRRVIVSDVGGARKPNVDLESPIAQLDRMIDFLFLQPDDSLGADDILIRPDVRDFAPLGFDPLLVDSLIGRGVAAALDAVPAPSCRAGPRPAVVPRATLGAIAVPGLSGRDSTDLLDLLALRPGHTVDAPQLRERIRRLARLGMVESLWLNPTTSGDTVQLAVQLRRPPRRAAALGFAYDNELGGRLWAGVLERRLFGRNVEASGVLFAGELRSEIRATLRWGSPFRLHRIAPLLTLLAADESVRRFDAAGDELPKEGVQEAVAQLGVERWIGGDWWIGGAGLGHLWEDPAGNGHSATGAVFRLERSGRAADDALLAEVQLTGRYERYQLTASSRVDLRGVALTPRIRLGWGDDLPLQAAFPLGGFDGFPGLHLTERRGQREAMASLLASRPVTSRASLRLELAAGRTADTGGLLGNAGWLGGARVGLHVDTPIGPVRLEYGYNTDERGALLVRVGRWF
ncbi:MAG TPA: patatin-like phospholipase family protein [Gemmatimonadales bacterium]|nr:patatin-like phospholipase family protein [Gemmatimonadales bacterium]